MNSNYLEELNSAQRAAVEYMNGPVMIIAGAGSGKTRVLTYRIAHQLHLGVDPFNILALTFTNKAAKEMKQRIVQIIGLEANNLWMGTFHSVFARILRIEAAKLSYPSNFTIYDTEDSKGLIKDILKEQNLDDKFYKPEVVYNRISAAKNNLLSVKDYQQNTEIQNEDKLSGKSKMGLLYELYDRRCFKARAMDFDDLLFKTYILLAQFPDVLHKYQHKFKYLLVDEFQDTNYAQYLIIKKLAALNENICVVGDDAQSIYAFRGANIQNILNFEKDYSDLKTFKLEQNYRSTKNIVDAANSVIVNNRNQLKKDIWTINEQGNKIKLLKAFSDNEEGNLIANSIYQEKINLKLKNKAFAILYRTNAQSRSLEEALRRLSIPYRIYGGLSFYKRREIKDLLAYFRLTINNNDEEALKRIINYPARGIGKTSIERAMVMASELNQSLWQVLENINTSDIDIGAAVKNKVGDFIAKIKSFSIMLKNKDAYELAHLIVNSSGILKELYDDKTVEGINRYENIQELLNGIKEFTEKKENDILSFNPEDGEILSGSSLRTLDTFMQDIALLTDADTEEDDTDDKVSLMTVHAAKGLEFPSVYISGLEENLFPSQLSLHSREDLEEERRLFYVAITRAQKNVTLSYATSRYRWGNLISCDPSRFLEEIKLELIDGASNHNDTLKNNSNFSWTHPQNPSYKEKLIQRNFKAVKPTSASEHLATHADAEEVNGIQIGMEVEHQRFGTGKVLTIDGSYPHTKATIFFQGQGQKQLLLKFAKLRIKK